MPDAIFIYSLVCLTPETIFLSTLHNKNSSYSRKLNQATYRNDYIP